MDWFPLDDDSDDASITRESQMWAPYTQAVRDLIDVSVRTSVDEDEIQAATAQIEDVVARLRKEQLTETLGIVHQPAGRRRPWGNPVIGVRNPMAPLLTVRSAEGRVESDFHCGAAFEGPPGLVHGGVVSMILDQVLGHAVGTTGRPGMTGTLTIVYRQGTPLGDLRCEAWVDRQEGVKTWARGQVIGPNGVTAEAEGVFILPRAIRERLAAAEAGGEPVRGLRIFE
ncbi:PaaI family thioesterase [Nocardioides sp. CPCC 206347]|uniref:PaaI family thioesterase n=1 Tax=unclassified Nocardioides TaxID=2615069 RepID=UPI003606BD4F